MRKLGGTRTYTALVAIVTATVLVVIGLGLRSVFERSMRERVRDQLTAVLDADFTALTLWLDAQRRTAAYLAGDTEVRAAILGLVSSTRRVGIRPADLQGEPDAAELRLALAPALRAYDFVGYLVLDASNTVLASNGDPPIGRPGPLGLLEYRSSVFAGDTIITRPLIPGTVFPTVEGVDRSSTPTMFVAAPVRDDSGQILAVLAFGMAPERRFSEILTVARIGETGETYAFDADGTMISASRFREQLVTIGLIDSGQTDVLNLQIRDPGGDMTLGFRPRSPRRNQPLTRMAADAVDGRTGSDVTGYRDYRGVPVVGAWRWLPEYEIGIATEVDTAEAYEVTDLLRRVLWGVFGLLVLAAMGVVMASGVINRLREDMVHARELGQYHLEEKIGEGGMGSVYRARHSLLRRPTAIKLLRPDKASKAAIRRFEREVRHTSRLTHPNTVAIYDYGHTPEGIFYYAMEYLPGLTLNQLVDLEGPVPEGRVVHILRQVCAALAEAHDRELIHRDIKPSNIMLCERGGTFDFVKVLDFGLVRQVIETDNLTVTDGDRLTGTPLYLAPETIRNPTKVDARCDLYALGAVAYFMLVGDHVFAGGSAFEVCDHHINTLPDPPSTRSPNAISPALEDLVLRCLAKRPVDRPADAAELLELVRAIEVPNPWTQQDAQRWWHEHAKRRGSFGAWEVDVAAGAEPPAPSDAPEVIEVGLERSGEIGDASPSG